MTFCLSRLQVRNLNLASKSILKATRGLICFALPLSCVSSFSSNKRPARRASPAWTTWKRKGNSCSWDLPPNFKYYIQLSSSDRLYFVTFILCLRPQKIFPLENSPIQGVHRYTAMNVSLDSVILPSPIQNRGVVSNPLIKHWSISSPSKLQSLYPGDITLDGFKEQRIYVKCNLYHCTIRLLYISFVT